MDSDSDRLLLYTDGGCHGNPGPGGWAWRLISDRGAVLAEDAGYRSATTNNRMELTAVIEGLEYVEGRHRNASVSVMTDSQYVRRGITEWITGWKRNGWRTAAKKPVRNDELWKTLDLLNDRLRPRWAWVPGHSGHEHNEACDRLVQRAIAAQSKPR